MSSLGRAYGYHYSQLAREEAKRKGIEWPPREKYDFLLELLLIGDPGVGKAHFSTRFCSDYFGSRFPPGPSTLIVADYDVRKVYVDEKLIKIQLWDTHEKELRENPNLIAMQYGNMKGIIIIYDITNQDSFESVSSWLEQAETYSGKETVKFLIGNKVDLSKDQRKVQTDTAIDFAHRHDMLLFETSGKDGTNVELAVMTMVAKIMEDSYTEHKQKLKHCCIA